MQRDAACVFRTQVLQQRFDRLQAERDRLAARMEGFEQRALRTAGAAALLAELRAQAMPRAGGAAAGRSTSGVPCSYAPAVLAARDSAGGTAAMT
jgi:hypothetical protein